MSNGKFSKPRPYRDEEREIEQAFRAITGKGPAPEPQPKIEDLGPLPEEFLKEELAEFPELKEFPQEQPPVEEEEEDFAPEEPDFIDKLQAFFHRAAEFCGKNPKALLIGACSVLLVILLGFMAAFFFGTSDPYGGKILSNVYIGPVNVGGMTKKEAVSAVKQNLSYARQEMVIDLSGTPLTVNASTANVQLDVKAAVSKAYDYGRTGPESIRQEAYISSLSSNHNIDLLPYLTANEDGILSLLKQYAGDATLKQTNYGLEGQMPELSADFFDEDAPCQTLVINMGTPCVGFDPEALLKQVMAAYADFQFRIEVENVEALKEPDPLDLEKVYEEFYIEPVNTGFDTTAGEATPGSYGYGFDLEAAQELLDKAEYGEEIRIPMEYIEPEFLGEDAFFRDVLGAFETRLSGNSSRKTNIDLACEALNGVIVNPGEEFSFNKALGEPTTAKGYKRVPVDSGPYDDTILGGGVSQAASALYVSAIEADLAITARTNHDFAPSYTDLGFDADARWDGPDLKFRNTTSFPIQLQAEVSGGYVKLAILGTDEKDYDVRLEASVTEVIDPDTEYKDFEFDNEEGYEDGDVIEEGMKGYTVKTYRAKYDRESGQRIDKDLETTSRYVTVDELVARVEPEETTEATTEETEPPTEEETEPETSEETEPETTEATEPETTAEETEPETTAAEETEESQESEPEEVEDEFEEEAA